MGWGEIGVAASVGLLFTLGARGCLGLFLGAGAGVVAGAGIASWFGASCCDNEVNRLHRVAIEGSDTKVAALLAAGLRVDVRSRNGLTPLHYAAWLGRTTVRGLLLASGADPDAADEQGLTALHYASAQGHDLVSLLLEAAAHVDSLCRRQRTPLHLTARLHRASTVARLCSVGADPSAADDDGSSPLHLAAGFELDDWTLYLSELVLKREGTEAGEERDLPATIRALAAAGANLRATNLKGQKAAQLPSLMEGAAEALAGVLANPPRRVPAACDGGRQAPAGRQRQPAQAASRRSGAATSSTPAASSSQQQGQRRQQRGGGGQAGKGAPACVVCMDEPRVMCNVPCGHMAYCEGCHARLRASHPTNLQRSCICRQPVGQLVRVFES